MSEIERLAERKDELMTLIAAANEQIESIEDEIETLEWDKEIAESDKWTLQRELDEIEAKSGGLLNDWNAGLPIMTPEQRIAAGQLPLIGELL